MTFDATTYEPEHDQARLTTELDAVRELMRDGVWRTLIEVKVAIGRGSEAGISARLRDLRKPQFGGLTVERRRRGDPRNGIWEYRVVGRHVQQEILL